MPVPEGYPFPLPFDNNVGQDAFREVPEAPFLLDVDDEFKQSNCYNGNMSLKANGVKVPITPEHKAEFKRCQHDVFYFLMNYGKIISLDDGEIKFKLFQYQKNMIKLMHENRFVINLLPRQMGKALCGETDILTNNGFVKLKDLKVGDVVYDDMGKPTNITNVTGAQYNRQCYEIVLSNGEKIIADENHDWKFFDFSTKKYIIGNTNEMLTRYEVNKKNSQSIYIDHCKAIDFEHKDVLIDPYELGMWIGDGYSHNCGITSTLNDYTEFSNLVSLSEYRYRKDNPKVVDYKFTGFTKKHLESYNLIGNKHIPEDYIFNSRDVRIKLIQGLMDTDGSVEKNGTCRFYQSDKNIIDQFTLILSTLGIKSTVLEKPTEHKLAYSVNFVCNDFDVAKLSRKVNRQYNNKNHPKNKRLYIASYKKIESVPVYCITVDAENHMFLAGRFLVPTHNCSEKNTKIKIRHKKTGEIRELTFEEFHELTKKGQ